MFEWLWYLIIIFVLASLLPACYTDLKLRKVPTWIWYPGVYIGLPLAIVLFALRIFSGEIPIEMIYLLIGSALLLVGISLVAGYLNIFGGADAIAFCLVVLTAFFYQDPINIRHPLFIFPFLDNFIFFSIIITIGLFALNIKNKNYKYVKNPVYLFFSTMIKPTDLEGHFFLVLEDVKRTSSGIERTFVPPPLRLTEEASHYKSTSITSDPDRYALYKTLDRVLVMHIIPMIVPITCAYITTIFFGDLLQLFLMPFRMMGLGI